MKTAIVGVGDSGCRVACRVVSEGLANVGAVLINLQEHDFADCQTAATIALDPAVVMRILGGPAAEEHIFTPGTSNFDDIQRVLSGYDCLILIAGLGGTLGSAMLPSLAQMLSRLDRAVICCGLMPFQFEGKERLRSARYARSRIEAVCGDVMIIDMQQLTPFLSRQPEVHMVYNLAERTAAWHILSRLTGRSG